MKELRLFVEWGIHMMKIRFNFFKKLMVYSIFLAFISVAIVQILNLVSLDYFYIYRKKLELPLIAKNIERFVNDENELNSYIEAVSSDEKMSSELNRSMSSLKSFVGNASHELKTPVSTINMISQNLRENRDLTQSERKKLYDLLIKESEEMNELIQNLLILSKITYSKNLLNNENLKSLIQKVLYKYELLELEKNIDVNIKGDEDLSIRTDYKFFKIVIENLIQNALKYSLENESIDIEFDERTLILKNKTYTNLSEEALNLFSPLKRGESSAGKNIEGSGLGLYIVKNILELLNLNYEIKINGDNFYFIIYLKKKWKASQI